MVLDAEDGKFFMAQALHRAVVQVEMGDLKPVFQSVRVNGVAVVLGGDVDTPGGEVADGVVAAAVTVFQLKSFAPEGAGVELGPQADAHNRLLANKPLNRVHNIIKQLGVTGAGGEEDAVRF